MESFSSFSLLTGLIGGLALFLYGMNVMSAALTKMAGGRLEQMLAQITGNRWIAYLFGIVITALVQSSSASVVMVVGMVNASLMTLAQAVNLILGANLGTTFTAWLLSLNAISSDNFLINLLKPTSFTPFLAIAGVVLYMFFRSEKKKNIGQTLLGFSVLMFGMNMMSQAVAPLKDVEAFTSLLPRFSNPLLGFAVGLLFTMVIQSSAGTIGVVQALSLSIAISYGAAIPVVIGAEVGTCITAILSSIGASMNAKRAAAMHLSYNILKAAVFMTGFYILHAIVHFSFLDAQAGMVGIALVHTLVNLVATPVMVPFSALLVKIAYLVLPVTQEEQREEEQTKSIRALDDRFLTNAAFAVQQTKLATLDMAGMAKDCLQKALSLLEKYDEKEAEDVRHLEKQIDHYEDQIGSYLVKLNAHHLAPEYAREVSIMQHCINDFERVSDHALNICQIYEEMHAKKTVFTERAAGEVRVLSDAATEAIRMATESFRTGNRALAHRVEPLEEVVDSLNADIKERHIGRLRRGKGEIDIGFDIADLCMNLERVTDHASNIAVCVLQTGKEGFDTHGYLAKVRSRNDPEYKKLVEEYRGKYELPKKKKSVKESKAEKSAKEPKAEKAVKAAKASADSGRQKRKEEKENRKKADAGFAFSTGRLPRS